MTAARSSQVFLRLRRLNEVESKLDRMMEELRTLNTPTAIGYSARAAFVALKGRAEALYVCGDALITNNRVRIITLALGARLARLGSTSTWEA